MKSKLIIVYAILLIISFQNIMGQGKNSGNYSVLAFSEPYLTGELVAPDFNVDQKTYFNSEWLSGDIYLSDGGIVRNKLIKYNGLLDELFWQEPKSGNVIKLDKEAILQFHFLNFKGDTSVSFRKIRIKRNNMADSSEVFGEEIYIRNLSLFVLHTFIRDRSELIYINGIPYQKDIYEEEPIYIFRSPDNKTFITKSLSRKNLYSFAPGMKVKIKEFLKTNRSGRSLNKSYLIRLTQFLNTTIVGNQ
jgi:hypothetical protein